MEIKIKRNFYWNCQFSLKSLIRIKFLIKNIICEKRVEKGVEKMLHSNKCFILNLNNMDWQSFHFACNHISTWKNSFQIKFPTRTLKKSKKSIKLFISNGSSWIGNVKKKYSIHRKIRSEHGYRMFDGDAMISRAHFYCTYGRYFIIHRNDLIFKKKIENELKVSWKLNFSHLIISNEM